MPILALGVSYRRAPVELLERLAFSPQDDQKSYRRLLESPAISEATILSTCNRVELVAEVASYHAGFQELKLFLAESREVAPEEFADPLYAHYESQAAEHLFSVASGIDSVVLGEPQILTQVRQAFRRAKTEGATGPVLSRLFGSAVRTGKRARSETAIGASPAGFVDAGVGLAERTLGPLAGRPASVVGAGAMAALAASHLRDRGMDPIRIVGRTPERAHRLAQRVGGEAIPIHEMVRALSGAALVISSTGATGFVIDRETVQQANPATNGSTPMFLLDLAVPRDVDPAVRNLRGVVLADLDDLKAHFVELHGRDGGLAAEVERVRAIVAQEVDRFEAWRRSVRLAPLIQALRDRGERIQAAELQRLAPRLADLSDRERRAVEALAQGIVAKLLHDPIVKLKDLSGPGSSDAHARALAELFGLPLPGDETSS